MATKDLKLYVDQHLRYIKSLDSSTDQLEYHLTEHLRLSGLYWGLTACQLLNAPGTLPREQVIDYALSCLHANGGFGAAPKHDAHILNTCYGVQILTSLNALDQLDSAPIFAGANGRDKVVEFVVNLQDSSTGAFQGDEWGEVDTRFMYCAINVLSLLGRLNSIDKEKCVNYVQACCNFDGAYGTVPGAESHSGQVFTCVGILSLLDRLDALDRDKLASWLSERQLPSGGLNGRPEKLPDVCYSWWCLSSLAMIDRLHWIDAEKLISFILQCQDPENGGFSDRPGNKVDVFHTNFAVAGLSLLGYKGLAAVDPRYCLPTSVTANT